MKVLSGSWQSEAGNTAYRAVTSKTGNEAKDPALSGTKKDDDLENRLLAVSGQSSDKSNSRFKMKSSTPG